MHKIQKFLKQDPDVTNINLDFENIKDLTLAMRLLKKFPNLVSLSLHGNSLKMLPLMTNLKLTHLDISRNPLQIDSYLLDSLYSLSTLEHLTIDGSEEELDRVVENLPNLKTLNGYKVIRQRKIEPELEIIKKMKSNLYSQKQKIQQISRQAILKFEVHDLKECDYSNSFDEIMSEFKEFSNNVNNDKAKEGIFCYSKSRILDLAMDTLMITLEANGFQNISEIVMNFDQLRKQLFDSLLKIVLQVGYDEVCLQDDLGDQLNSEMKNLKLRKQRLYLKEIMRLKKKLHEYRSYLNKSQQENQKLIAILYSFTKGEIQKVVGEEKQKKQPKAVDMLKKKPNSITPKSSKNLTPSKSMKKLKDEKGVFTKGIDQEVKKKQTLENSSILNLDQTIKLISQIVDQKQRHNNSCLIKRDAFLTGQEFLTVFFTKKFGKKSDAADWSIKFIRSLDFNCKKSSLCKVFLKILKNNIEQSFYEQHKKFTQLVEKQLSEYLEDDKIRYGEAQLIFKKLLSEEQLHHLKKIEDLSSISPKQLKDVLNSTHIIIHEDLLSQFKTVFNNFDPEESGILSLSLSKDFVMEFFKPKVQKYMVTKQIPQKILKKLDSLKKNKIIFSQLVSIVDSIV